MSGTEIVGLVVGVFPLVISALAHYHDVHKVRGLLTRFESEYRKTVDDIKDEELMFRLNLEELLLPLAWNDGFEDGDLEMLIGDPSGAGWKDEDISDALEERLGQTYIRFMEITASLQSLISRLLVTLISDKLQWQEKLESKVVSANRMKASKERLC